MKILAINSGSASLKFKLYYVDQKPEKLLAYGEFKHYNEESYTFEIRNVLTGDHSLHTIPKTLWDLRSHQLLESLLTTSVIKDVSEIEGVVHRIVHGGEKYKEATIMTDEVIQDLKDNFNDFAPLHNPVQVKIIEEIKAKYPNLKQIGVFDTSFNLTIPEENYLYALPYEYYRKYKVRRYGFHGISHKYITETIIDLLRKREENNLTSVLSSDKIKKMRDLKIISCHLGSGSSVCAINGYSVVDNSFGFSPNENLVTSTRVGEVDFDALLYLKGKLSLSDKDIEEIINKKSGLLGISEYSEDMKVLLADLNSKKPARLAISIYVNQVVRFIAQYITMMNGIDVLIFTGGIGSGSDVIRQMVVDKLKLFQIDINQSVNKGATDVDSNLNITGQSSKSKVWVIHTEEELQMVREAAIQLKDVN